MAFTMLSIIVLLIAMLNIVEATALDISDLSPICQKLEAELPNLKTTVVIIEEDIAKYGAILPPSDGGAKACEAICADRHKTSLEARGPKNEWVRKKADELDTILSGACVDCRATLEYPNDRNNTSAELRHFMIYLEEGLEDIHTMMCTPGMKALIERPMKFDKVVGGFTDIVKGLWSFLRLEQRYGRNGGEAMVLGGSAKT